MYIAKKYKLSASVTLARRSNTSTKGQLFKLILPKIRKFNKRVDTNLRFVYPKMSRDKRNEFIKENFSPDSPLYKFQKGKSKVQLDVKPMSNDIAMLNTDTRDRETIVIITDSIA